MASLLAAASQDPTALFRAHALHKSGHAWVAAIVRLKRPLHDRGSPKKEMRAGSAQQPLSIGARRAASQGANVTILTKRAGPVHTCGQTCGWHSLKKLMNSLNSPVFMAVSRLFSPLFHDSGVRRKALKNHEKQPVDKCLTPWVKTAGEPLH